MSRLGRRSLLAGALLPAALAPDRGPALRVASTGGRIEATVRLRRVR